LKALLDEPTLIIGELTQEARNQLEQHPRARLAAVAACSRRAGYLAELGWRQIQSGEPGDPRALDALYVS